MWLSKGGYVDSPSTETSQMGWADQPSMSSQVADVDTGVINWINADLVTHIVPRV